MFLSFCFFFVHIVSLFRYVCVVSLFTLLLFIRGSIFCVWFYSFFSINVFPIILVIIIIILSTTFFLLFANGLPLLPRTNVNGSHVTFPSYLLLVCLDPSTLWKQKYSLLTGMPTAPRPSPDASSIWAVKRKHDHGQPDFKTVKLSNLFTFVFLLCLFLLNVEVPNYIIKFLLAFASLFVLFYFLVFLRGFNYIKL